jgi:hypothetical protein
MRARAVFRRWSTAIAGGNCAVAAIAYVDTIVGSLYFRAVDRFADAIVKLPIDADE